MIKKLFLFLLFLAFPLVLSAQRNPKTLRNTQPTDTSSFDQRSTSNKGLKNEDATIDMYKIVSFERDTTIVDTTISIQKDYKFNYLRRDNFGLMQFSNIGQTYNSLTKTIAQTGVLPIFGARARHFNYMETEDINYYYVPTPLTELFFKTAFQQGQVLDAFFTVNTSPQFNFSIAYKGLRSLGNYQHILTSTGNFRVTSNYHTKNKRYNARVHIVTQDLLNQENGGLLDEDIPNFESGAVDFLDRAVFSPQFENAESILVGKRVFLDHQYEITKPTDSLSNKLIFGQTLSFEDRYYQYDQTRSDDFFGEAFVTQIVDRTTLENFFNRFYLNLNNKLGEFTFNLDYTDFNYGYDSVTFLEDQVIPNRIKDNTFSLGGSYKGKFKDLSFGGDIMVNVSGEFDGSNISAFANYRLNEDISINSQLQINSSAPNYNFLLYQSDYINYNWYNLDSFENVNSRRLLIEFNSEKILNASLDVSNVDNYTFFAFDANSQGIKPFQSQDPVNYFKVKVQKEIKFGNFALDNTIMYQNVVEGEGVLNVPEIITRNTLYYSNSFFKKALKLQTGITFNYFTEYFMDAYDPLLAEFYVQNDVQIGNFPRLDFFVNAKVRQTRIFLKAEHFNAAFTGYNYFSAPNYPYRDFAIRFGLVWNFFL